MLVPNMCLTIEPGLYLPNEPHIPEEYRGIGIRIEDDILITQSKPEVLTSSLPTSAVEVERVCQGQMG